MKQIIERTVNIDQSWKFVITNQNFEDPAKFKTCSDFESNYKLGQFEDSAIRYNNANLLKEAAI